MNEEMDMDLQASHAPVVVTGTLIEQSIDDAELDERLDGDVHHGSGHRERQVIEWSDARLPAVKLSTFNYVEYDERSGSTAVFTGSHLLEGMEGSWSGSSTGVFFADGSIEGYDLLVGQGAYAGLYAVLFSRASSSPNDGGVTTWRGVICTGSPPPAPPSF
jgi:hypothetical protein